jgi:DNA polymerase-4
MARAILFIDPPAFVATVERMVAPALRSRPLAVAPPGADRATVLALSPEAQAAGVRRGMLVRQARKLCPDLILIPPNPRLYARASRALHEILRIYAPVIEPRGYGHAFLDLSGTERLFGPLADVAERIRREAGARLRIPLTVGASINKLVSEAATRVGRLEEGGRQTSGGPWPMLVPGGSEAPFLAPHSLPLLPGVPEDMLVRLDEYQLERIGQVAAIGESELCAVFGGRGRTLSAQSRGIDARPVLPPEVKAEYRLVHTFATDTNDLGQLHAVLRELTRTLGHRLRRRGLAARRLGLAAEYADGNDSSRRVALPAAALDAELWAASREALALALTRRVAVRTLTLTADRLLEARAQLDLFEAADTEADLLQRALDRITRLEGPTPDGRRDQPVPRRSPAKHQLADRVVALHDSVGGGRVGHRRHLIDDRAKHGVALLGMTHAEHGRIAPEMGTEERQHPLGKLGNQRDSLLRSPGAHHRPDDLEPLAQNRLEASLLDPGSLQEAEQHQPAAGGEQRQVIGPGRPSQHVEDEMDRHDDLLPPPAARAVDAVVEPEIAQQLQLLRRAGAAQHGGAQDLAELDGRGAHPAGSGMDQHGLPAGQMAAGHQGVVGGEKRLRNGRRVAEREMIRHRHRFQLVHRDQLGVGPTADQPHDPVTGAPAGHALTR